MAPSHRRKLLLFVPLLVMLAIASTLGLALTSAAPPTPREKLADIFANARAQNSFHMVADVEQTLIPKSMHSNAGQRDQTSAMRILGDVTKSSAPDGSDASRAHLMLYAGTEKPVELILADMKAYVGYDGRWQVVEDPLGGAAPGGDTLGYLAAATDVVEAEAMQTAEGTLRRYTFNVDGPAFAEYQRQRMQAALAGQLPQGAESQASPALQAMSGTGELWVDGNGLPRRQIMDLNLPDATDRADARMHMVVDFSRYNDPVAPIRVPELAGDGSGLVLPDSPASATGASAAGGNGLTALRAQLSAAMAAAGQALAPVQGPLRQISLLALVLALGALALIVLGTQRRRRSLYVAVATALTVTMVAQPLLEVGRLIRFDRNAEASPLADALYDVGATQGGTTGLNNYIARWQQDLAPRAVATTDLRDCRSLYSDISPVEDSDGDGLSNETEWCLGTDYSKVDTDGDTITDTVEVQGFDYNSQTWTSDPLNSDSNGDGMNDGDEWKPNLIGDYSNCVYGENFNDYDCDGVPNLWDDDNDGDGVPDGNDISPFAVEPYRDQFQLTISGPQTGNALYIDIQVRPTITHVRYSLTTLDWPSDSLGQIQDLNDSTDDMQLIPVLEVKSQISPTLSQEYGINVKNSCTSGSNTVNCYSMWVPLQTNESAGKIYGFSARIALTADEAQNVISSSPLLASGRIRWLTQAALDQAVNSCQAGDANCTCDAAGSCVLTNNSIVASYLEDEVQVTGVSITQIRDVEVGLFGTGTNVPQVSTDPNVPDEDKVLMQLMSAGLAGTYLYTTTAITELATNFANPAPDQPLTTTWGITPSIMHVLTGTYPHRDVALATTNQTTTVQMLNEYYVDCSTTPTQQYTPTLALAYQEISGNKDLLNMTRQDTGATLALSADLSTSAMATMHQTQLTSYTCATGGDGQSQWTALPLASPADRPYQSALGELSRRYPSQSTERFFSMVQQLFMQYYFGRSNIVAINGQPAVVVPASQAAFGWLVDYETNNMPDYVRKVYQLDALFLAVDTYGTLDGTRDWSGSLQTSAIPYVGYVFMVRYMIPGLLKMLYKVGRWIVTKVNAWRTPVQPSNDANPPADEPEYSDGLVRDEDFDIEPLQDLTEDIGDDAARVRLSAITEESEVSQDFAEEAATGATEGMWSKIASGTVAVAITIVIIVITWVQYANNGLSGIAKSESKGEAEASTIVAIAQLMLTLFLMWIGSLISSTGVGLLIELVVFVLIWLIWGIATGDWNPVKQYEQAMEWLTKEVFRFSLLAEIPSDGTGVQSSQLQVNLGSSGGNSGNASAQTTGPVSGTWSFINTSITTTIQLGTGYDHWNWSHDRAANAGDVAASWAFGRWDKLGTTPSYLKNYSVGNTPNVIGQNGDASTHCELNPKDDTIKYCHTPTTTLNFQFTETSGRNTAIPVTTTLEANLRYEACYWDVVGYTCEVKMNYSQGPAADSDKYSYFYFDVLPNTLDGLVQWDSYNPVSQTVAADFNADLDNDGLLNSQETADCTNGLPANATSTCPTIWDSDGDGLSDGWEVTASDARGTDATLYDTDGDGLNDLDELNAGTSVVISDTDSDGLLDGQEVCRFENGRTVGGWLVRQAGNYRTCSNPLQGDYDGDHLLDSQEMRAGLSPNSPNTAPWMELSNQPSVIHNGARVSVLKAGDPLTATLYLNNTTAASIVAPLTLDYATSVLVTPAVVAQTGSDGYVPPEPGATASGLSWNLSANPLYSLEAMTSTLAMVVNPDVTTSQVTSLKATAVYSDVIAGEIKNITETIAVLVDMDEPTAVIDTPANGAPINGTAYTIGGTASDPTSWPTRVDVRVTGNSYDTGWQEASGAGAWGWTWTPLPADGVYTIATRATDYAGNVQSTPTSQTVIVDNTAPAAGLVNFNGGVLKLTSNQVTLYVSGDDTLSGAAQVAGLQVIQISIDGRPWTNVSNSEVFSPPHPPVLPAGRSKPYYKWTVNNAAYGSHTVEVRAVDSLGQVGDATSFDVIIDTLPPTDIWSNYEPYQPGGQAIALLGHADDEGNVPLPARPQALENTLDAVISSTVRLMPEAYTDTVGMNVTWLGDVNGDARADLAVGMPSATANGYTGSGRVSVIYGQPGGWPVPPDAVALANATNSFAGSYAGQQLGQHVAPAGDVNSDGLSDFLIGDPAKKSVYLVYGSTNTLGMNKNPASLNSVQGKTLTVGTGLAGTWQAAAGDVNGDGFDDLLIGVTGVGGSGRLYLVSGKLVSSSAGTILKLDVATGAPLLETFTLDANGAVATGVGDLNNDQYDDFVVADPNNSFGGGSKVYLFLGPPTWRQTGETGPLNPTTHANASFAGSSGVGSQIVALGDVNGDSLGLPDFLYSDGTAPKVVYGRTSGWTGGMSPDVTFSGSTAFDSFITAPGDVNADGINDILLGSSSAGGTAFLYHGRSDLASNQPVQAEISGASSAASAPYAAGADLNCDLSSDLLVVPNGQTLSVESVDGSLKVRNQVLTSNQQGQWIGPAAAPYDLRDLPEAASLSPARAAYAARRAADLNASLTTPALAFRVVSDNIDDWTTADAMVGDFDGDGKTDVAGWSGSSATSSPEPAVESGFPTAPDLQGSEAPPAEQPVTDTSALEDSATPAVAAEQLAGQQAGEEIRAAQPVTDSASLDTAGSAPDETQPEAPAAGWRIWHSDGYSSQLSFTEYTNNLPTAVTGSTARLPGDFDGDQKTDIGYWDGASWQFVRSDGASGSAFSFTAATSNLGSVASGDTGQTFLGDFDGDGKTDIAAWNGSAWATYVSQASGTTFDFTEVSNNLGALSGSDASLLVVGDFDGDSMTDVAARASDTANWVVWLAQGGNGSLTFQQVTATSLGYAITSSVPRVAADFSGDGKADVLALFDNTDFYAWLSQASPDSGAAPFRKVLANALQFGGSFPANTLTGDFDGDTLADYVSLDAAGTGWDFQLSDLAATRVVDDDFCETCANDGLVWGKTAFATLQSALDASWHSDILLVQPGTYAPAVIDAGRDYLTIRGSDPDSVFLDAGGGTGLSLLPNPTATYPNLQGVTVENLTIRNASTAIKINYGGDAFNSPAVNDGDNVVIRNVLFYLDTPNSTAIQASESSVWVRHNTLVSNAPGVTLVHSIPGLLTSNYIFLQDNLFVALPNASPLPRWWRDDVNQLPGLVSHNAFASQNGVASDWFSAPNGSLMTVTNADFLNVVEQVFRIGASSQALNGASDGKSYGYYTYHVPVTVDPTYCQSCDNDGLVWGQTAFNSIQDGIDSGAQRVLIEPGVYRERVALVNGVSLFGSGAGLTVLAPPDSDGGFLLGAENARLSGVALMTIAGEGNSDGIQVDGRGSLTLKRAIVRNTGTAISVSGSDALATLVNDTIVTNDNGVIAANCGSIDARNTILAYHQDTALAIETCATTSLHTFNAYWQNGNDLAIDGTPVDQPGPGEIFANPRFTDPNHHDYRPQSDSPVVDAGDPSDPAPPGSGERVDLGYAQSAEAAVYASLDYCEQCLNDGLEWQVTAFDTIQDAVNNVPDIDGIWTVGVAGGSSQPAVYHEQINLPSGVRLIGAGADSTVIDGDDTGSALTLNGVTHVEITGFTVTDAGEDPTDAGIAVTGASNNITITYNIIGGLSPDAQFPGNGNYGVLFADGSTGALTFNTIALNYGTGVVVQDDDSWLHARFNIIALNDSGLDNSGGGQIFNANNLVYNTDGDWCLQGVCQDYLGSVEKGPGEINQDPLFQDADNGNLHLCISGLGNCPGKSPAIDGIPAADYGPVPTGGGLEADMGYKELLAMPATLLLGKEGNSCGLGSAGVASVQVGLVYVPDSSVGAAQTPPSSWQNATLATANEAGSYWTTNVTPSSGDGLYRLYTRPTDGASNVASQVSDWYRAAFIADGTAPAVTLVEPGGGATSTAPAVTLAADVLDWTPTGVPGESSFTVDDVTFLVDSTVVTATQAVTVASAGQPQRYLAQVALENGTHTVTAVATDLSGNVGQSSPVSLTVVTTQNQAALANPAPGSAVNQASLTLQGYVHFQDAAGDGQVEVLVNNVSQGTATLADPTAQATSWSKPVTLAGEGSHTITLRASRTAGTSAAADSTATLVLDTVAPSITFDPPTGTVTRTVTLDGSASDATSGLAAVSVSVDGGHSYQNAALDGSGNWTFDWEPDLGNDYAGFPVRVRAVDSAGNATVDSATVTVDNLGPTPISLVSVSPQEGSHVQAPTTINLEWLQSTDGSGTVTVYAAVDQITGTIPSQTTPIAGNSYAAAVETNGTWYVHLLAVDSTGNQTVRHFGPWFAETGSLGGPPPISNTWQSSVQVNGYIDIAGGEWEPDTELLGSDPRPGRAVSLYATWDSDDLFLAWRGTRWGPDGTGAIFLDTQTGGTTTPYGGATETLPFEADYVVAIGLDNQQLLAWNGSDWQPVDDPNFLAVYGGNTDTEIRVPRGTINATGVVRLLATVINDNGSVRSVLPDLNPLGGPWSEAYSWPGLLQGIAPNAGQPDAHHARVTIALSDGGSQMPGPGSLLNYVFHVSNIDALPLEATTLVASGSDGLRFESLSGWPPPTDAPTDDRWFIDLGTLQPDASLYLTITARVKQTIAGTDAVTVTAKVQAGVAPGEPALSTASLSHAVDGHPPRVRIALPDSGATLRSGQQMVAGTATDIGGGGVASVEVRVDDGPWQPATGTRSWSAQINVPASGPFTLAARAFDVHGFASDVASVLVTVDNQPPTASIDSLPPALRETVIHLTGTASDPFPSGGAIAQVEVQIDGGPWQAVAPGAPDANGLVAWTMRWQPGAEEGVAHTIRARATDAAGNTGPATPAVDVVVDTVAPSSMIAYPESGAVLDDRNMLVWGLAADGWGVAEVDVSLDGGTTWATALLGDAARDMLASLGVPDVPPPDQLPEGMDVWAIQLEATNFHPAIRSRAVDLAGNVEPLRAPVRVTIDHVKYWLPLMLEQ